MEAEGEPGLRLALLGRGHEQGRLAALGLGRPAPEDPLGGAVERDDSATAVDRHDGIEAVLDDLAHEGVFAPKLQALGQQTQILAVDPQAEAVEIGAQQ